MKSTHNPILEIPATGLEGLKKNWKADIIAGFLVFLIALPLCLGIAMASKFPPIAGIMTAVVGGLIVTFMQGSFVTIKGPAAGLIVIVLGAVEELGGGDDYLGYKLALAVIVVAGIIQILLGLLRTGVLGDYFPSSAVHGMLAAIGVIIAAKQIHTVLGVKPMAKEPLELIAEIPHSIMHMNPEIAFIGIFSLVLLFTLPLIKNKFVKMIPGQMLVLIIAIPLGSYFMLEKSHHYMFLNTDFSVGPNYLVPLPTEIKDILSFPFPDFSQIFTLASMKWVVLFALVGSLESLLSTKAVDILDPYKRKSNLNKDMVAVGIGNTICGFIGALPMISEIVRSSANISNGAKTKWSNFFHAMFLLLFVLLLPTLLKQIPLAALGAMLIFTGYRLASPKVFKEIAHIGKDQLLIFLSTLIVTLATDLIIGIVFGILVNYIIHFFSGATVKTILGVRTNLHVGEDGSHTIVIHDTLSFANYLKFKKQLLKVPAGNKLTLDFSNTIMIDHTVLEHLYHYAEDYQRTGGQMEIKGLENLTPRSSHPLSARVRTKGDAPTVIKTTRVDQFKQIATDLNWKYLSSPSILTGVFKLFSDKNISIKYLGSALTKEVNGVPLEVIDISTVTGGSMKAQIQNMTVFLINKELPSFVLTEEGALESLFDNTMLDDIDFNTFPKFSRMYKLIGTDVAAIRNFFNPALISYLELNHIYNIESNGNQLIIFKNETVATTEEIKELITFSKGFLQHI